ncbi:uncharacterized protein LOC110921071 isoform X2 [Helianthus annuus]|uniref:uncharacterized protein LOC110921071 isoform X2 n=1 Tax=Helianthus annuus TaxID=4232 RepID=UPI001653410B|nr:uncharacterized protein LOC110921071 isoform X2 [Helianthus annuus]
MEVTSSQQVELVNSSVDPLSISSAVYRYICSTDKDREKKDGEVPLDMDEQDREEIECEVPLDMDGQDCEEIEGGVPLHMDGRKCTKVSVLRVLQYLIVKGVLQLLLEPDTEQKEGVKKKYTRMYLNVGSMEMEKNVTISSRPKRSRKKKKDNDPPKK